MTTFPYLLDWFFNSCISLSDLFAHEWRLCRYFGAKYLLCLWLLDVLIYGILVLMLHAG